MNIKNRKEYATLQKEIKYLSDKVETLETKITGTTKRMNTELLQKSGGGKGNEELIIKYIELKKELEGKLKILLEDEKELEEIIDGIDDPVGRMVIRYRYIDGMTWKKIAQKLGCNEMQVYRIRRKMCKKIKNVSKC